MASREEDIWHTSELGIGGANLSEMGSLDALPDIAPLPKAGGQRGFLSFEIFTTQVRSAQNPCAPRPRRNVDDDPMADQYDEGCPEFKP